METLDRNMYRLLVTVTLAVLGFGTIFYHVTEKWNLVDSYYFCVVTLTTVGYGDYTPHTQAGKLFTTFYIIIGIGILGLFINTFMKRRGIKFQSKVETRRENKLK